MKKYFRRLVLPIFFVLIICEVLLHLIGFGHPILYKASASGYEFVPNQSFSLLGKRTHISNLGTRGEDAPYTPEKSKYRILVVGDSVSNGGIQTDDSLTWPKLLQDDLGEGFEVLNASIGGWAIPNEFLWLKEHGVFGARLVILEVNQNDLYQPFASASTLQSNPSFPTRPSLSAMSELVRRYVLPRVGLSRTGADPGSLSGNFDKKSFTDFLLAINNIRFLVKESGGSLVVVYWDPLISASPPISSARDQFFSIANGYGVPIIRPHLDREKSRGNLFRDAMHPNARGNVLIAQRIRKYFSKTGFE